MAYLPPLHSPVLRGKKRTFRYSRENSLTVFAGAQKVRLSDDDTNGERKNTMTTKTETCDRCIIQSKNLTPRGDRMICSLCTVNLEAEFGKIN